MALAEMVTWNNFLMECISVQAGDHKIVHTDVHPAKDRDAINLIAYCDDCQRHYVYSVSDTMLSRLNFDTAKLVAEHVQRFIDYLKWQPCVGKSVISAIAQWLTDKLAEKPMSLFQAEALWQSEGEDWNTETVRRVAEELCFIPQWEWLELPAEHPLAKAA